VIRKLQYFLTIDDAARYRAALIGASSGLVSGMLFQWLGGAFHVSAYISIGIAAGIFTLRTWIYCRAAKPKLVAQSVFEHRRVLRFATAAASVFLLSIPTIPKTEARAVDRRLRALTRSPQLTPDRSEKIADALGLAQRWDLSIASNTLVQVRDAIKSSVTTAPSLEALPEAADALGAYGRSRDRNLLLNGGEALAELNAGTQLLERALKDRQSNVASYAAETYAAIAAYTRAIQLSDGDRDLRIRALMNRSVAYSVVFRFGDSYTDAKAAEDLDPTDLYAVFFMEGVSLANHVTNPDDLRQAARLLTIVTRMQPPTDLAPLRSFAVAALAEVHYYLGEFKQASEAALQALASAPPFMMGSLYQLLSLCYLRSGEYEQALTVALEYSTKVGDVLSARWLQLVRNYPRAPQSSLSLLEVIRQPMHMPEAAP
jgi:tetratricopeptide (TPR) repeat protein